MGQLCKTSTHQSDHQQIELDLNEGTRGETEKIVLTKDLLQKRVQAQNFPILNAQVLEKIKKLTKIQPNQNKIWQIKSPFNTVYQNQKKQQENDLPRGYVQVYKLKENNDFNGYFQGQINQHLKANNKGAIYVFSNASFFQGTAQKTGIFINEATGLRYQGGWQKGQPEGKGTQASSKGQYIGTYHLGEKEGKGSFKNNDGVQFEGELLKSTYHGKGKLVDKQRDYSYEGEFLYGQKYGKGIQCKGRQTYEGSFYRGKRLGKGKLTVFGQQQKIIFIYEGLFQNGFAHGRGIYTKTGCKPVSGIWRQGKLISTL